MNKLRRLVNQASSEIFGLGGLYLCVPGKNLSGGGGTLLRNKITVNEKLESAALRFLFV